MKIRTRTIVAASLVVFSLALSGPSSAVAQTGVPMVTAQAPYATTQYATSQYPTAQAVSCPCPFPSGYCPFPTGYCPPPASPCPQWLTTPQNSLSTPQGFQGLSTPQGYSSRGRAPAPIARANK